MRNIVFEITDNEQKVLAHYCMDPQDWIENAVGHLIEQAKDKLFESEHDRDSVISSYNGPLKGNPNG